MTKSPLALARAALAAAAQALPQYSSKYSKHDFTQHQLFAILVLRAFLKTDYRGIEELLKDWSDLRSALGLTKIPDHSTLQKAHERLLEKKGSLPCSKPRSPKPRSAAGFPSAPGGRSMPPGWRPATSAATSCGARASATCGLSGRN
jgi:hypothetical protein